jgi:hypothetical protein
VILAIAKNYIKVSVPVQVVLVNTLQDAFARNIEILAGITAGSLTEILKTFSNPYLVHLLSSIRKFAKG